MGRAVDREPESPAVLDGELMEGRYRWLGRYMLASEPDSPAAALHAAIVEQRDRLDRSGKPLEARLAALEAFLNDAGVLEQASRFADRFTRPRMPNRGRP